MTTENNPLDTSSLSFSQEQGYEDLPQPLRLEEISDQARVKLWNLLYQHVSDAFTPENIRWQLTGYSNSWSLWLRILQTLHVEFLGRPLDEFSAVRNSGQLEFASEYRSLLLQDLTFNRTLDLLQMIMRHPECPEAFIEGVAAIFEDCRLAYKVNLRQPVTIVPAVTEQEGAAVVDAMRQLDDARLAGAGSHLREASQRINQGDWSSSIRESIHAVESVARQLDPEASRTLDPALRSLETEVGLHPALKGAFSRLYGYTSDEDGIRHALLDDAQSRAGMDEALFMLSACAAFCSFLLRKYEAQT
ncbi:MAG: hypothetical protein OXG11_12515 [Chloroflexi bacterium]|nr:hypothetical protein [Chloroflexota bacterium]